MQDNPLIQNPGQDEVQEHRAHAQSCTLVEQLVYASHRSTYSKQETGPSSSRPTEDNGNPLEKAALIVKECQLPSFRTDSNKRFRVVQQLVGEENESLLRDTINMLLKKAHDKKDLVTPWNTLNLFKHISEKLTREGTDVFACFSHSI